MAMVDGAMMHPIQIIIAVRTKSGSNIMIQVYNLGTRKKLKEISLNYEVEFWKWLNDRTIGLVSLSSVLVLDISEMNSPARKVFDKQGGIAGSKVFVMNLACDPSNQWYALSAISSSNAGVQPQVIGFIQLYNIQKNVSQNIEGFAPSMRNVKCYDDNACSIFCFIDKNKITQIINY